MKKDGDWIAAIGCDMKVQRIDVAASPMLGLIEVSRATPEGTLAGVEFYDAEEAIALANRLTMARAELLKAEAEEGGDLVDLEAMCKCGHKRGTHAAPAPGVGLAACGAHLAGGQCLCSCLEFEPAETGRKLASGSEQPINAGP